MRPGAAVIIGPTPPEDEEEAKESISLMYAHEVQINLHWAPLLPLVPVAPPPVAVLVPWPPLVLVLVPVPVPVPRPV